MFGNTILTATMGAAPRPGADSETWVKFARAMADAGLPTLLVEPGSKRPADFRTDKERAEDTELGRAAGVHLATTDRKRLAEYVKRATKPAGAKRAKGHPAPIADGDHLNWAVRLAGSGYVVADADTPDEVAALQAFLAPSYTDGRVPGPTVLTPGSADQGHHGGGHWWFRLPEGVDLDPELVPAVTTVRVDGVGAFNLYAGNAYVLVPPSIRAEGPYSMVGTDHAIPMALWAEVERAATTRAEQIQRRQDYVERAVAGEAGDMDHQVAVWSASMPWEAILEPAGWTDTGMVDGCGCPIWTAPGSHSSPKSATAHNHLCSEPRVDCLNPPIHLWTDNPGPELEAWVRERGTKTVSKLTTWALLHHDGNMAMALLSAGIDLDPTGHAFGPEDVGAAGVTTEAVDRSAGTVPGALDQSSGALAADDRAMDLPSVAAGTITDSDGSTWVQPRYPLDLEADPHTPGGLSVWEAWDTPRPETPDAAAELRAKWPPLAPLSAYRDRPPPQYIVEGMLEDRGLTSIIGDSGVGKSALVLDMAAHIVAGRDWHGRKTRRTRVLYVAGEGVTGAVDRMRAWQKAHGDDTPDTELYVVEEPVLFGQRTDVWAYIAHEVIRLGIGLVIFDTLARMAVGLDENSATDMGKAVGVLTRLQKTTGAGVCYVHHVTRGSNHARGSSSLRAALDSELLVTDTMVDGRPFATDGNDRHVDADGSPLPGKPITVKVSKQKNGPDDEHEYLCLTSRNGSLLVTDLEGNLRAPGFAKGAGVSLEAPRGESLVETAERVAEYVSRYQSGEKFPTMSDIARAVTPDRAHADRAKAWRAVLDLATDKALEMRRIYKVGAGYSTNPPLD